jgi:hypothetical protein
MILLIVYINKSTSNDDDNFYYQILLNDTIYIPDAIFWVMYVTLYWKVIQLFYSGRIQSGNLSGNIFIENN